MERASVIRNLWAKLKEILVGESIHSFFQISIIENDLPNSNGPSKYFALTDAKASGLKEYILDSGIFMCIEHKGLAKDLGKTLQKIDAKEFEKVVKAQEVFFYPENYSPEDPESTIKYLLPIT